jgi:hypothetical protein
MTAPEIQSMLASNDGDTFDKKSCLLFHTALKVARHPGVEMRQVIIVVFFYRTHPPLNFLSFQYHHFSLAGAGDLVVA